MVGYLLVKSGLMLLAIACAALRVGNAEEAGKIRPR